MKRVGSVFNERANLVRAGKEDQLMIKDEAVIAPGLEREMKRSQPMSRIAFPANGFK